MQDTRSLARRKTLIIDRKLAGLVIFLLLACNGAAAGDIVLESGDSRTSLLELYTAEGCSSCPPADRFLSKLIEHPDLWSGLIPVAFHVDYWDYIGWRDRFADRRFSDRQRDYARSNAVSTVYTPGFILDGAEWRASRATLPGVSDYRSAGRLTAAIDGNSVLVGYEASESSGINKPVANIALLGFGLSTEIEAGENNGRTLDHDFVVLGFQQVPMQAVRESVTASLELPESDHAAARHAIAIWVSEDGQPHPVQAVGGWLK